MCVCVCVCGHYHADAAVRTGVSQVIVQQLGRSILEGFGQSAEQHRELWRIQLEEGDEHHLSCLHAHTHTHMRAHTHTHTGRVTLT